MRRFRAGFRDGLVVLFIFLTGVLFTPGCSGSKITKENATKIKSGMSEGQIVAILGEPTTIEEVKGGESGSVNLRICAWKNDRFVITATFTNGTAVMVGTGEF